MSVGVQLPLMHLVDGGYAAISAENDVVNEIGITLDEAKVALISDLNYCCPGKSPVRGD